MAAVCLFYVRLLWLGETNAMLSSSGESALLLSSNLMGGDEIGVYVGRVGSESVEALRKQLADVDLFSLPTRGTVPPESLSTVFGLQHEGEAEPRLKSFLRNEMPPGLLLAERGVLSLVDELRKQRAYVLAGSGRWTTHSAKAGAELGFELRLRNSGPNAIRLSNPSRAKDGALPLTLQISREGTQEKPGNDETLSMALSTDSLVVDRRQRGSVSEQLELSPGAETRLVLRKAVYASPGTYHGVVRFATSGDENAIEVMRDFLFIPLGPLVVEA